MRDDTIPQTVLFPDLFNKRLLPTFDQPHASSDGGAVLLKAAERRYGLIDGFALCLVDDRQPRKVRHTLEDLLAQRIFGLACGHPDANDADGLADDAIYKLLLGRDPVASDPLASQPTISRFENHVGVHALYAMGCELAASVVDRHRQRFHGRARRITIDPSISTRPMTRPMARSSSPSLTATMTAGAICRCWRSSPSTTKTSSPPRECCRRRADPDYENFQGTVFSPAA